ncbi:pancreatic lipase-related protein 2-like [Aphis gossypii]|uniref:pancreatic lipase-related protein 2-like n=1 Tax=Aphis gossypii TaxID=80765 RepID=UPI002159B261|nr:pancreatic lipase-related protein 2-like [Aphis gossypii]
MMSPTLYTAIWILCCLVPSRGGFFSNLPGFKKFKNCVNPSRECPNPNITFHLYTRITDDYVLNYSSTESLKQAPFITNASIKLLIHGYTGHKNYSPNTELRPEYLKYQDLNVISVDYKELVQPPCYVQAVYNVPLVGKCTNKFLQKLFRVREDLKLFHLHVIGFSLGAQVAGHVGRLMNSSIERVTGLDPASPMFSEFWFNNEVLDKSDAKFVDVLHTNIGLKGKISPLGHLDFYANNGCKQPGCTDTSCSHVRAVEYFAESINTKKPFMAVKCLSYVLYKLGWCKPSDTSPLIVFGEHVDKTEKGVYYFMTNEEPPFSQGNETYYTK